MKSVEYPPPPHGLSLSIMQRFGIQAGVTILLLLASVTMLLFVRYQKNLLINAYKNQELLILASNEIKQTSQDLTRL